MNILSRILGICHWEWRTVRRDKGILIFILFVPLAYPLLYAYVYTNEVVREVPVAAVDESNTRLSRDFLRRVDASPDVRLSHRCADMTEAEELLKRQEVYGVLRIPRSFTRDLWKGEQTHVGLYCDMCSMLYYKACLLTCTNVSLEMNRDIKVERYLPATTDRQEEITRMPIEYDEVALYNPQSGFAAFLIPPVLMLIIQQTLLLGIGMGTGGARERYSGCALPASGDFGSPLCVVLGRSLPYFLLYFALGIYMFTFVTRAFGLPQLGDYLTFLCFLVPYLLSCVFMGMTLSALVWRREDCILLFVFLSVPLLFLSGISWPGASMPAFWKYVSWLFPSTFGMNGYVRITGMGAGLGDVRAEYAGLWVQALVYGGLALLFYRREVRRASAVS